MKRIIKFRAWHKTKSQMVDVNYFNGKDFGFIQRNGINNWVCVWVTNANVNEFELMQYTGLKDAKNRDIYESDIVRIIEVSTTIEEDGEYSYETKVEKTGDILISKVGYLNGMFVIKKNRLLGGNNYKPDNIEIIGNIYENPELLATQKKDQTKEGKE